MPQKDYGPGQPTSIYLRTALIEKCQRKAEIETGKHPTVSGLINTLLSKYMDGEIILAKKRKLRL